MSNLRNELDLDIDGVSMGGEGSPKLSLSNRSDVSEDPEFIPNLTDNEGDDFVGESAKDAGRNDNESIESEGDENEELGSEAGTEIGEVSKSLGLIDNLSHAAIGDEERELLCLGIASSKPRELWLKDLAASGYAGLLFANMKSLRHQNGFNIDWWFKNRTLVLRRLVQTPLESIPSAGIFTLKGIVPGDSLVNAVVCTVAELVASDKASSYCASTIQLFVPSEGGFSQDFIMDEVPNSTDFPCYRCFWYIGPDEVTPSADWETSSERSGIFVGSAGDNVKLFGNQKVVTLAGYFGEGDRKFRLHSGDILLMNTAYPFAVDLPIGGRVKDARVISWIVYPKQKNEKLPRILPESEIMMSIENFIASNEEAHDFYREEFENFEINPGPIGDPQGHMQRLRVTPKKYKSKDVIKEVEKNASILYVDSEYFS